MTSAFIEQDVIHGLYITFSYQNLTMVHMQCIKNLSFIRNKLGIAYFFYKKIKDEENFKF